MERINRLLHHPNFIENLNRLKALEADRAFCCHGLSHLLDVARIACLLQYKNKENDPEHVCIFPDEIIYAAALLHDMGRIMQYEQGLPHETAGLSPAGQILKDCDFTIAEQKSILNAIRFHRMELSDGSTDTDVAENPSLQALLHYADKLSRNCFACAAAKDCYWPESKKNQGIIY